MKQIVVINGNSNPAVLESAVNHKLRNIGTIPEKIMYLTDKEGQIKNVVIEYDAA